MPNGDNNNKDLEAINQEISDMQEAERKAQEQGLKPWEYNLSSLTSQQSKERLAEEEKVRKAEEALTAGEAPAFGTTTIGGEIARKDITPTEQVPIESNVVEKTYPGGGTLRTTQESLNLTNLLDQPGRTTKSTPANPAQLYYRQQHGFGAYGEYGSEEIPYDPQMEKDYPALEQYRKKYGAITKVRQVVDKNNLVGGKPTMYVVPSVTIKDVIRSAPKQSEFKGDLNYLQKHEKAMENYFKDVGIEDWKKMVRNSDEFRNIYDLQYGQ